MINNFPTNQPKNNQYTDYFLHIKEIDVKLFGLNAAAILSVIRAGDKWRIETNLRNKKANDIAEMHGDKRWLPEDVSLGFTNQDFIDRTFGLCGRNAVIEAVKILIRSGVISQHENTNKKYHGDKSRYFRFHQDVYDELIIQLKYGSDNESEEAEPESPDNIDSINEFHELIENSDRLNLNDDPFKNKRQDEEVKPKINAPRLNLNGDRLNSGLHIMNSNNKYKKINNPTNAHAREGEIFSEHHNGKVAASDETKPIVDALIAKGMNHKRFYPDSFSLIASLLEQGATMELFCEAYDKACHSTQGDGFGINYLAKIITEKLKPKKVRAYPNKSPPAQPKYEYQNDFSKGLHWMSDLLQGE